MAGPDKFSTDSWLTVSEFSHTLPCIPSQTTSSLVMSSKETCLTCGVSMGPEIKVLPCTACYGSFYCSDDCLQEDFVAHKLICGQYHEIKQPQPQPPNTHTIALLFPEHSASPYFVWLRSRKPNGGLNDFDIRSINRDFSVGKRYEVSENLMAVNPGKPRFAIGHGILLYACKRNPKNYGENICIDTLMNKRSPQEWRGPFLVVAYHKDEMDNDTLQNVTLGDYRNVVDFLRTYNPKGSGQIEPYDKEFITRGLYVREELAAVLKKGKYSARVKGVIIHCRGDRELRMKERYEAVEVKEDHPAFSVNCTKLSAVMSFALVTFSLPADRIWRDAKKSALGFGPYENQETTLMHLDVSAMDEHWGWANDREWTYKVGSVLVVRKDGTDLTIHQVEAHIEYCKNIVQPAILQRILEEIDRQKVGDPLDRWELRAGRKYLLETVMGREHFKAYFEQMKKDKIAACHLDWVHAISPYEPRPKNATKKGGN